MRPGAATMRENGSHGVFKGLTRALLEVRGAFHTLGASGFKAEAQTLCSVLEDFDMHRLHSCLCSVVSSRCTFGCLVGCVTLYTSLTSI